MSGQQRPTRCSVVNTSVMTVFEPDSQIAATFGIQKTHGGVAVGEGDMGGGYA